MLVLFGLGAIGGFVVAAAATTALERLPLPASVPVTLEISPDLRVLAFAIGLALAAGLICGIVPALQGARRDITDRLKAESAGTGRRRSRLGRGLVAGQLALSLVLLVAAGLFVRAMDRGSRVDPGFDRDGVLMTPLEPEAWGYDAAATAAFYAAVRERVASTPGVTAVAYASRVPLMFGSSVDGITYGTATRQAHYAGVDEGYFDVLRLPIRRGRGIARTDVDAAPRVAVVNETLARMLSAGRRRHRPHVPLPRRRHGGRRHRPRRQVRLARRGDAAVLLPAAGADARPTALPAGARGRRRRRERSSTPCGLAIRGCRRRASRRWPTTPGSSCSRSAPRPSSPAASASSACCSRRWGCTGRSPASVARRTREIGVRLALGADARRSAAHRRRRRRVAGARRRRGGVPLAALAMPLLRQWLFEIDPRDPATYAALSVGLAGGGAAGELPAGAAGGGDGSAAGATDRLK